MATYKSSSYDGRYYQLKVTFDGTGTITATLTSTGGNSDLYAVYNLYVKVGSEVLWEVDYAGWGSGTFPTMTGSETKTVSVSAGTSSVDVVFKGKPYNTTGSTTNNGGTFTLDWDTYTVSYDANGGSGAPNSQTKTYGVTLTLSSTKPTRSGYTFVGWGTSASDTSADYSAGGSYTANAGDTLYAIWKKTITLTYDANGGSGAPSSQSATVYNATTNNTFTLSSTKPTRTGYTFLGWSTSSTATSSSYSSGGSITLSSSDTLYAVWSENVLTVNYYSNYATHSFADALNAVGVDKNVIVRTATFYYDNEYTNGHWDYSQSGASTYLGRTGYTATGNWGTSTNGGTLVSESTSYASGQALAQAVGKSLASGNASVNLYPQWTINSYTIAYNANGGSGSMSSQSINWNASFTLSNNTFKREGYKFLGWNLFRNDDSKWYVPSHGWLTENDIVTNGYTKKLYQNQETLTLDNSWVKGNEFNTTKFTLYAIWEISGVIYIDNGTTFEPYLVYIDNGTSWDLYLAYIDDGTNWHIMS